MRSDSFLNPDTDAKQVRASYDVADAPEIVALVTAYNEEQTIGDVLDGLKAAPSIDQVHVVDDGSTDATRAEALARGVQVTSLPLRVPVGQAIMEHLDVVDEDCLILWCDADLVGLTPAHIEALVARYRRGDVSQSLSSRAVPPSWPAPLQTAPIRWGWKYLFGPISGERLMRRRDFVAAISVSRRLGWTEMMRGYGIVLFLNWYLKAYGSGNAITYLPGLRQRQKFQKWGNNAFGEMVAQWLQFIRIWFKIRVNARKIRMLCDDKEASLALEKCDLQSVSSKTAKS